MSAELALCLAIQGSAAGWGGINNMATRTLLESHPHPKYPRLFLDLRHDSRFYQARTFLDSRLQRSSTKTDNLKTAFKVGEDWYRSVCKTSVQFGRQHPIDKLANDPLMSDAFTSYKGALQKASKVAEADKRWGPIAGFWRSLEVTTITSQTFLDFFKWRRRTSKGIKPHTLHKDVTLIRQVLKFAVVNRHIKYVPVVPQIALGDIDANPRPWLTHAEYDHLLKVSEQRINDAKGNSKLWQQRQDCHDQAVFMVHSMMRVDELLTLRIRDCRIEQNSLGEEILLCEVEGKRGFRTVVTTTTAADIFKRRLEGKDASSLLFEEHHRDCFRELLDAAGLRKDKKTGFERNFKSLRATAISFRILADPNPNLLMIARNAGTSLNMIDQFYASRLAAQMGKDALSSSLESATAKQEQQRLLQFKLDARVAEVEARIKVGKAKQQQYLDGRNRRRGVR